MAVVIGASAFGINRAAATPALSTAMSHPTRALPHSATAFSKSLVDVVAPGTISDVSYKVPAGEEYNVTELVLSSSAKAHRSGSGGSPSQNGEVRVQLAVPGTSINENILAPSLSQLDTVRTASAGFRTPIVIRAGDSLVLSVLCASNQAACDVTVTSTGDLVKESSTSPSAPAPVAAYLQDIVSPGTISDVSYKVPSGHSYNLTDLAIGSLASSFDAGQTGEVRIQLVVPGSSDNKDVLAVSLTQLDAVPFATAHFHTPLVLTPGDMLVLSVSCGSNQAVCEVTLTGSGELAKRAATAPSAPAPVAAYLEDVVSPGTLSDLSYKVPIGRTYKLTDLLVGSLASDIKSSSGGSTSQTGEVRGELVSADGSSSKDLFTFSLSQLNGVPFETPALRAPLVFTSGQSLVLSVSCGADQAACDVTLTTSGVLSTQ